MHYADHPEYIALVRAVRAASDDNLPRLVAADWLEEHGQPDRARYIRGAIDNPSWSFAELTKDDPFPLLGLLPLRRVMYPEWDGGRLVQKERTWGWSETHDIGCAIHDAGRDLWYAADRGFIAAVRGPADAWLAHGDTVYDRHPVRRARLTARPAMTETELCLRWPGVTFELPPEPVCPNCDGLDTTCDCESTDFHRATVTITGVFDPLAAIFGDGSDTPAGPIDASALPTDPGPRPTRRGRIPTQRLRFPRPR